MLNLIQHVVIYADFREIADQVRNDNYTFQAAKNSAQCAP